MAFTPDSIAEGNICVIWVDDMIDVYTWRETFGIPIQTPNLDRLMNEGVRFSNAYATVPLCAPCRAELATGISPFRSGLVDLNRLWRDAMPPEKAWAYDLRRAGFYNFTTGKVDGNYKPMPAAYKRVLFHEDIPAQDRSGRKGQKDYLEIGPGVRGWNHPDDDGSEDDKFYDFTVAQNAIDFLNRADPSRRHLIQLGFKHPHYNLDCPDRFYAQYDVRAIKWPDIAAPEDYYGPQPGFGKYEAAYIANGNWIPEKRGDETWRQVVRAYFAAISHVDHELGRFLDALKASAFAKNTTVIFLSDNGFNLGNHDSFHKMSQWDSAAHIPFGIWHADMTGGSVIDLPISLHNFPKTIMQLAGLPARPDWSSGQSLLPLLHEDFGEFDRSKSPLTCVFGTLSVRPSVEGYTHLRYFRYPNGEEHVYDIEADPGETKNLIDEAPIEFLRNELVKAALELGLDLRGFENPMEGVNAMMAVDGSVVLEGGQGDNNYWAYGKDAENIKEKRDGGKDTLWYMAGPDDYILHCPANVETIRIATVVSRHEEDVSTNKTLRVAAHPESPITFETSERVQVDVQGSNGNDVMIGPKYGGARFQGGAGDDSLTAISAMRNSRHFFFGGAGNDILRGGAGRDHLDGGTGDDVIFGGRNNNKIYAGHGNDTIYDGDETSFIDLGPGRNSANLAEGDDTVLCGIGINDIRPGTGAVKFVVSYGGVTIIRRWNKDQIYDLSDWPKPPVIHAMVNRIRLRSGLSIVDLHLANDPDQIRAQIVQNNLQ